MKKKGLSSKKGWLLPHKLYWKHVQKTVLVAACMSFCLATPAMAVVEDFFLADDLPKKVEKVLNDQAHSQLKDIILTQIGDEDFFKEGWGTFLAPFVAEIPVIGMFTDNLIGGLFGVSGPSPEESLISILTAALSETEGRIIDAIQESASNEALSGAYGFFDWYELYSASSIWSQDPNGLDDVTDTLSSVRNYLELAGGDNALRNLHVYTLLAGMELQIHQRLNRLKYLEKFPNATDDEVFDDFLPVFRKIIENVEDYVIYGKAGSRGTWMAVYGYRGYSVSRSVYEEGLEPVLSILDVWRRTAGLPRRDWADAEFYRAKTFGFNKGRVVKEDYDDGVFRVDLYPSLHEPLSVLTATIRRTIVGGDGSRRTNYIYVGSGQAHGGFTKEQTVNQSSVVEYTLAEVCGYMYMSSRKTCYMPSYSNKMVLNITLDD